jgi:hypothetical protein
MNHVIMSENTIAQGDPGGSGIDYLPYIEQINASNSKTGDT